MSHSRRIIWFVTHVVALVLLQGSARRAAASPQDQGQSPGQQQQGSFRFVSQGHELSPLPSQGKTATLNFIRVTRMLRIRQFHRLSSSIAFSI